MYNTRKGIKACVVCVGMGYGGSLPDLPPAKNVLYQPPPWVQISSTVPPGEEVVKGPEGVTLPPNVNFGNAHTYFQRILWTSTWHSVNEVSVSPPVDNDPHFIIHLPTNNMDVCFNIDSKPGHILNLVSDKGTGTGCKLGAELFFNTSVLFLLLFWCHLCFSVNFCPEGLVVNGQLIGSKQVQESKLSTYFGTVSVYYQPDGVSVAIGTDRITLYDGRGHHSFTWEATAEVNLEG